jgi:predicted RND superfamily exporter protein
MKLNTCSLMWAGNSVSEDKYLRANEKEDFRITPTSQRDKLTVEPLAEGVTVSMAQRSHRQSKLIAWNGTSTRLDCNECVGAAMMAPRVSYVNDKWIQELNKDLHTVHTVVIIVIIIVLLLFLFVYIFSPRARFVIGLWAVKLARK